MSNAETHERHMRRAIQMAQRAPQYPFGAVIVETATNKVVAEGWNRSSENPIWHGEIDVINNCARDHPCVDWKSMTLYTTAEPCLMCQGAIAWAGISNVIFGTSIPFLKDHGWWQIDIRAKEVVERTPFRKITLVGGVLEKECNELFIKAKWKPPAE